MTDAYHYLGNDLQWDSTGDVQTVSSVTESQQRILRRIITNQGTYWWNGLYGGSLPRQIGAVLDETAQETDIQTQMFMEESVVQSPAPQITYDSFQNGADVLIKYVEQDSQDPVTLSFSIKQ